MNVCVLVVLISMLKSDYVMRSPPLMSFIMHCCFIQDIYSSVHELLNSGFTVHFKLLSQISI